MAKPVTYVERHRQRRLRTIDDMHVAVGFPDGSDSDIILRAYVNEFGTQDGTVPERPFLRNAMGGNVARLRRLGRDAVKAILDGRITEQVALSRIGLEAQGLVQEEITDLRDPPKTASRRGL